MGPLFSVPHPAFSHAPSAAHSPGTLSRLFPAGHGSGAYRTQSARPATSRALPLSGSSPFVSGRGDRPHVPAPPAGWTGFAGRRSHLTKRTTGSPPLEMQRSYIRTISANVKEKMLLQKFRRFKRFADRNAIVDGRRRGARCQLRSSPPNSRRLGEMFPIYLDRA